MSNAANPNIPAIAVLVDGRLFFMQDRAVVAAPVTDGAIDMAGVTGVPDDEPGIEHIPMVLRQLQQVSDNHARKVVAGDYDRLAQDDCKDFSVMVQVAVNVRLKHVRADSAAAACEVAADSVPFSELFRMHGDDARIARLVGGENVAHVESADEVVCFLVDQIGDEDFSRSRWMTYNHEGRVIPDLGM